MRTRLLGDRYRLGPVIGVGGMGAVHRARDELLGTDVAVKVLRAGADAAECERLRREVEYLSTVQHPNLVAILDGGADDSDGASDPANAVAWFVMELVPGPDLRTLLRERGPLAGGGVRRLLTGVLGALASMHAAGLVHRDVTPSNILLTAGPFARWEAKLADLGIARRVLSVPLTDAGHVVGTAAYLSPEQVVGGEVGPATDVYALALVAVEALTGVVPFPGTAVESATSRLLRPPTLPAELAPEWRDLLLAATAVDPADRPDVAAFLAEVAALPEDAGVRPVRPAAVAATGSVTRPLEVSPTTSRMAIGAARTQRSTVVMPAVGAATEVMRAAVVPPGSRRRDHSRFGTALAATAAIVGGIAILGSAALVGTHMLRSAAVVADASSTPRPTASASATASADEAAQADGARTDDTGQAAGTGASRPEAPAAPVAGQAEQAGPAGPGDRGPGVEGQEAPDTPTGADDGAAPGGPAGP